MRLRRVVAGVVGLVLVGCSTTPQPQTRTLASADMSMPSWHSCRVQWTWEQDQPPPWAPDGLLAVAVFAPAMESVGDNLEIWRFHRRAGRDGAGRRFSFIFRSNEPAYQQIREQVLTHPLIVRLQQQGVMQTASCRDVSYWSGQELAATSDPAWSPAMQEVWPHYIHGVSRMWLELMKMHIGPVDGERSVEELLQASAAAHETISLVWQGEGRHALLHHLSGVFAYQPVLIRY